MRSIELTFDPDTDAAFRAEWAQLSAAGLPNLGLHQGSSNRPHLTLAAGPGLQVTDALLAVFQSPGEAARPPLSIELRTSGLVLFQAGPGRSVLARPVVMTRDLLDLHRTALAAAPGAVEQSQPNRWTPHVTLARRLTASQVAEAIGILGPPPAAGLWVAARFWNGEQKTLTALTIP